MPEPLVQSGPPPRPHGRVLIVDDESLIRWSLRQRFEAEGHQVSEAATGGEALQVGVDDIDLVLLDYRLPDADGLEVMAHLHDLDPDVPVIMITAHSSVEHAVKAMQAGAFHYAGKPFDLDQVVLTAERALETTRLKRKVRALSAGRDPGPSIDSIVGESSSMREVKSLVRRIAHSPASTVLVTGESGTGKDLVANAIHAHSSRSDAMFVNITCSALPANLLESELFGHERGAFTDAKTRKIGLLEHADGGSVFLDEIGEMEMPLQAKLLRVLEDKSFRRVGGNTDLHTDVRVIAATNVDLREAVRAGKFREDLYYRLAVLAVHIPPLREREGDLDLLATYFVHHFNREFNRQIAGLEPEALDLLRRHPWPGNVRELRNAIERAVLLAERDTLGPRDFGFLSSTAVESRRFRLPAGGIDIRELEKDLVIQALERTGGNQTHAAKLLGMNRDQVRYRIERFGIGDFRK